MAVLPILVAPHPVLKTKAKPVENITDEIRTLLDDMLETMYNASGVGLAAPQVGVSLRVVVIDVSKESEEPAPIKMVNPEVIWESPETRGYEEGCLSFPEQYSEVVRPDLVKVKYLDENGNAQELEASELLSTCIQHEIDHLDGVNFVDHLSNLKRNMIMRKLKKTMKTTETAYETA